MTNIYYTKPSTSFKIHLKHFFIFLQIQLQLLLLDHYLNMAQYNHSHQNQLHQNQLAKAKSNAMARLVYIALGGLVGYLFTSGPNSDLLPGQQWLITYMCAAAPAAWPMLFARPNRQPTYIIVDHRGWFVGLIARVFVSMWMGVFVCPYVVYKCIRTLTSSID